MTTIDNSLYYAVQRVHGALKQLLRKCAFTEAVSKASAHYPSRS